VSSTDEFGWNIVTRGQNQSYCTENMFFPVNQANVLHSFLKCLWKQIRRSGLTSLSCKTTTHLTHNPLDSGNS